MITVKYKLITPSPLYMTWLANLYGVHNFVHHVYVVDIPCDPIPLFSTPCEIIHKQYEVDNFLFSKLNNIPYINYE